MNPVESLHRAAARGKLEIQHALELVILPGIAIFLPWSLAFKLFQWLSNWSVLYREVTEQALAQAKKMGWVKDENDWSCRRRLVTLIDHADFYLAKTRSDQWFKKHFTVTGTWPEPGQPGILCTFHWGAGMWSLRSAAAHGLQVHALVATLKSDAFQGRTVLKAYATARTAMVSDTLGRPTLDVSGSLRPALQAIRKQEQVLAVIDVPMDVANGGRLVKLLGVKAQMPRGLFRVAADGSVPITVFLVGFDASTGKRFLRISQLGAQSNMDDLMEQVYSVLDEAIREDPPAWHFWSIAPGIFVDQ